MHSRWLGARLQETAKREFDAAPRSLSPDLYQLDAHGQLAPLKLDGDHPVAEALLLARAQFAMSEHEAQKTLLEEKFQAEGTDVFVASVSGMRNSQSGEIYTLGYWGEDIDTLLAKTDYVAIGVGEPGTSEFSHFRVPWEPVIAIAGTALARTHEYGLPRWRTTRWLTQDELAHLRKLAVAE